MDLLALGLDEAAMAAIDEAALAARASGKGSKVRKARAKLTDAAWVAAKGGVVPSPPVFPQSNLYAGKKGQALYDLAMAGDRAGVAGMVLGGTNTYAKALRSYRDAVLLALGTPSAPVTSHPTGEVILADKPVKGKGKKGGDVTAFKSRRKAMDDTSNVRAA